MEGDEEEEGDVDEEDVGMRDEEGDVDITDLNDEVGLKVIMVAHKSFDLTCMHELGARELGARELGARELGGHPLFFWALSRLRPDTVHSYSTYSAGTVYIIRIYIIY